LLEFFRIFQFSLEFVPGASPHCHPQHMCIFFLNIFFLFSEFVPEARPRHHPLQKCISGLSKSADSLGHPCYPLLRTLTAPELRTRPDARKKILKSAKEKILKSQRPRMSVSENSLCVGLFFFWIETASGIPTPRMPSTPVCGVCV